jgi:hypothetical protein
LVHDNAPGDQVYLEATNLRTDRPTKKLDDKRFGPFKIKRKVGRAAYELHLPAGWPAVHPVFNESLLTPYRAPSFKSQQKPPPPPPILDEQEQVEYEAEVIRDSRRRRGNLQYLVHWKGYPREDDTWEPAANVKNSPDLVEEFHQAHPKRPSPTNNVRSQITASEPPDIAVARLVSQVEVAHDQRLYDEFTQQPGIGYQRSQPTPCNDALLMLTPTVMDQIHNREVSLDAIDMALPTNVKRIWLYETEPVNALTFAAILDPKARNIAKLYQLTDPIGKSKLRTFYNFRVPRGLSMAPEWMLCDGSQHRLRLW